VNRKESGKPQSSELSADAVGAHAMEYVVAEASDPTIDPTYPVELSNPMRKRSTTTFLVCAEARPIRAKNASKDLFIFEGVKAVEKIRRLRGEEILERYIRNKTIRFLTSERGSR